MKKLTRKINSMMFDVAVAPLLIVIFGVPLLIIAAVIVLIIVAVKLIRRARAKERIGDTPVKEDKPAMAETRQDEASDKDN